uniref:Carrier domain-containing protein n=1 Tax=Ascaris lumbricoides TaxID=6252 RepID=A0A0M3INH9_ASCLU
MLPSRIIHVEKFPLNQNSKVDRNALRTIIDGNISTASGTLSDVETKIRRIWCETLKKNQIGVKDNFFAMGGHSLLATTICFKIRETLHCECPVRYLFENQTVEKLAKRLFVEIERARREKIQSQRSDKWSSCGQDDRNGDNSKMAGANMETEMSVIRKQASLNEQRTRCTTPRSKSDDHANLKYSKAKEAMQKKLPITFQQGNMQPLLCCQLQKPLLHLYSNNPDGPYLRAYETGFRIQLRIVDRSLLNRCVNRVITSHDALRTSFLAESKSYLQEIKSATESFVALRYRHEKTDLFVSNPFDSIPILSFLEEADGHTNFVLRMSHVITDARSMQIIAEELYTAYNGHKSLPRNANTYANFSKRYRQKVEDIRHENEQYWRNIFTNIDRTILSTDKPRTTNRRSECGYVIKNLSSLNRIIERLSRKNQCSNFVVMIAALSEILRRRLDQESKVVIGCPMDMRDDPSESSVGFYISTIPVVIEASQSYSTAQLLLHHAAQQVENAIQHSTVSGDFFNSLCGDNELISCMIILDNFTVDQLSANNYFEISDENSGHTKYELSVFITQRGSDITIKFEYMSNLFYKESIIDMINGWAKCINAFDRDIIIHNDHLDAPCSVDIPSICLSQLIENASLNSPRNKSLFNHQEQYNYLNMLEIIQQICNALQQCIICTTGEPLRSDTIIPIISTKSLI